MSLENYQKLHYESLQNEAMVGNRLPDLEAGLLEINTQELNLSQVVAHIAEFKANASWVMFSDRVEINNFNPDQGYIVEGEWSKGEQTLNLKLLQNDSYILTHFISKKTEQSEMVCTEQTIYLRPELKEQTDANACRYRFWWQQVQGGGQKGRWQPLAQQFIGFTATEDIEPSSQGDE